jgi:hypothetical protein
MRAFGGAAAAMVALDALYAIELGAAAATRPGDAASAEIAERLGGRAAAAPPELFVR